jgi:cytochrome c553
MKTIGSRVVLAFAFALASATAPAAEPENPAAKLAIQVCDICHGSAGRSISPTFPRLAGQMAPYVEAQLTAFKDQTRKDPDAQAFMWGMASQLDAATIKGLAQFYAEQTPEPAKPEDPKLVAAGSKIFSEGIPTDGVPPCATCHGKDGQGVAAFPRLAGQHVAYQVKQLEAFRSGLRASPIMQPIAVKLSDDDMRAVATYTRSK